MSNSIIICADRKEQEAKRNAFKKHAKGNGTFLRVDHNTVVMKGGEAVTFVVEEVPEMDEEPVYVGGNTGDTLTAKELRKAVRDMMG